MPSSEPKDTSENGDTDEQRVIHLTETNGEYSVEYNADKAADRVAALLQSWDDANLYGRVESRTTTLAKQATVTLAVTVLINQFFTGLSGRVLTYWSVLALAGVIVTGSIAYLLRTIDAPSDVQDTSNDVVRLAVAILAVLMVASSRHRAARAVWRYILTDVPFDTEHDEGRLPYASAVGQSTSEDRSNSVSKLIRGGAVASAGVILLHQAVTGFQLADVGVDAGSVGGVPQFDVSGSVGSIGPGETVLLLVGAVVVGSVIGLGLAVTVKSSG